MQEADLDRLISDSVKVFETSDPPDVDAERHFSDKFEEKVKLSFESLS